MLKRKYILLILFLVAVLQAAGQDAVVDSVCVGSARNYRVQGESGSTYQWIYVDQGNNVVYLNGSQNTTDKDAYGNTIFINEITIPWNKPGEFNLEVVESSVFQCDTTQEGIIKVFDLPNVIAGNPLVICSGDTVRLNTAFAENTSSLHWSTDGDGSFTHPDSLRTDYNPGSGDLLKGDVRLKLTGQGMAANGTCTPDTSSLKATFMITPNMVIHDPAEVCPPETVDLSHPLITQGSDPMTFEYYTDSMGTKPLANYTAVNKGGTYYIQGTSNSTGCKVLKPVHVTFTKPTVPSFSPIEELCLNSTPPTLPPSSLNGGISGTWTPDKISTNAEGTFAYTFHPGSGPWCATDTTIYVTVSKSITPLFDDITVCQGDPASLPSVSKNGVPGTWDPASISTASVGTFTYNFTPESGGCGVAATLTVNVTDGAEPQFSYATLTVCQGDPSPAFPVVKSGGNTITGTWTPSVIATDVAKTTIYKFDPDPGQCVKSGTIVITVSPKQKPQFAQIGPLCYNDYGGNLTLPATSVDGISGSWNPSFVSTTKPGIATYRFTPAAGFCADTTSMKIEVYDQIKVQITADPLTVYGGSTKVTVTATGGSGLYTSGTGTFFATSGWHTYTVTDSNGCTGQGSVYISEPQDITVTASYKPIPCNGGFATVVVKASGGTSPYIPSKVAGQTPTTINDSTFQYILGADKNPYVFEVFDSNGSYGSSDPLLVTDPAPLSLTTNVAATTNPTCPGGNDGTAAITVSGGSGNYSYLWNDPSNQTTDKATGLSAGAYLVTVKDLNCSKTDTLTVHLTDPPAITMTATGIDRKCSDANGFIRFTFINVPDGKYDISYNGGVFSSVQVFADTAIVPAPEQTYNNLQISVNGCVSASGVVATVNVVPGPALSVSDFKVYQPDCNQPQGAVIFLNPKPNTGFSYSVDGQYQVLPTFSGLGEGDHILQIKDLSTGCESNPVSIHINPSPVVPPAPQIAITHYPDCADTTGTFVVSAPLGTDYLYTIDGKNFQVSPEFKGYQPGSYSVQVQDKNIGCLSPATMISIPSVPAPPDAPTASVTAQPDCDIRTGTIEVTSPMGANYTYSINDSISQSGPVFSNLNPGVYSVKVKNTDTYCESAAILLTVNPAPPIPDAPVSSGNLADCYTGSTVSLDANTAITPEAGITISWYDKATGGTLVANPTLSGVGQVIYYAEAFDGQCTSKTRTPVKLTISDLPAKPIALVVKNPTCNDPNGTVQVTNPVQGTGFEYRIDGGSYQASSVFTGLVWGDHIIQVRNATTHCESDTTKISVPAVPPAPVVEIASVVNCMCYGDSGRISFNFTNVADGIYNMSYDGGQFSGLNIANDTASVVVPAGTYNNLTIETSGCSSAPGVSVTVKQPAQIVITENVTEIDLKSQTKASIDLSVSGGTGKYAFLWSTGDTLKSIQNLDKGSYTVTVTDINGCSQTKVIAIPAPNFPPVAVDDEFSMTCSSAEGNLLTNDYDPEGDPFYIDQTPVTKPVHGTVTINADGTFNYTGTTGYTGTDQFTYAIYDAKHYQGDTATVTIQVVADMDNDGIPDDLDPDADGDGILNVDEALPGQDWKTADNDGDGRPNWLDIDSDNDGIVDNIEAQSTPGYIPPSGVDKNHNGIDDAYDPAMGGTPLIPVDTDGDGIPDFLDTDSDNDHVPDYIEGNDANHDGIADFVLTGKDSDSDGLDDAYDTVDRCSSPTANIVGSQSPLQDTDGDGIRDWRDVNDDGDQYPTVFEDLNGDGDYSNDDTNHNGIPEYLDPGRDCQLLIPEAFSPNGDNIHDYFQIYCLENYPNARIYIFDKYGNKIFEQGHYGNLDYWGSYEKAWWNGKTTNRLARTNSGLVPSGTYFYVLELGNGEVKKSYVFVSY